MNINKKISIIFFIIFTILSTAFAYSVNAEEHSDSYGTEDKGFIYYEKENHISGDYKDEYEDLDLRIMKANMKACLVLESLRQHSYDNGKYIPLAHLYEYYDVLCCQKGTNLPSSGSTYLVGSNGDGLGLSYPNLTMNDLGTTIFKEENRTEALGSDIYTNLTLGYYKGGTTNACTPKEAYILSEMVKELDNSIFYYDIETDSNGNKVIYEGSLDGAESLLIGNTEIFIVEKEYVAVLDDGTNVRVEAVSDGNGGLIYKYKNGSYQNRYDKYEGSLQWNNGENGSGTYPSFESKSNASSSTIDNAVPSGTQIYITGSTIVVKEGEQYYRATVEGNNSYVQLAWWTTIAGGTGNAVNDTAFSQEADAFEAYILQAAGVTSTSQLKHKTATVVDDNGSEKKYENAFEISYKPTWIEEGEFEYPVAVFEEDKQTYLVGPFSIDYIEANAQFGTRPEVQFSGITNMELYVDSQEEELTYGEQWELVYLDGERLEEVSEEISYPKSNEKFYIRLDNIENATKITNIKVDFKYMNAAGSWQELHGTYFKATWEKQTEDIYKWVQKYNDQGEIVYDENGNPEWVKEYDYTKYWLELTNLQEFDSQFLGLGVTASKWYEYATLERKVDVNDGKVIIEKKLVDDEGNEVKNIDEDKFFTFKITVDGATNSGTEEVRVRAGESVESKVYYWIGDKAPTYKVEEIKDDEYELVSIENSSGTLKAEGINVVPVVAKNNIIDPEEGYLNIIKIIEKNNSGENSLVGTAFDFHVRISGTFEYNGEKFKNESIVIPVQATAASDANNATPTVVGPFYWYNEAPTYEVKEIIKEGTTLVSLSPDTGKIIGDTDTPVTVTAINRQNTESASIRIIKVLEGSSGLSKEYIESLTFTFDIKVDGYAKETINLKTPTRKNENGDWVWEGTSSKYVWLHGKNPNYTITEVDVPKGTTFDEGRSEVSGTLISNKETNYEVTNNIINTLGDPNTGKIEIVKNVEDSNLINKNYQFKVTVTGEEFKYVTPDGTTIELFKADNGRKYFVFNGDNTNPKYGDTLQLTNNSAIVVDENSNYDIYNFVVINAADIGEQKGKGTWISGEFTWNGDKAPEYKVEENLLGEDIASSVEPSEGTLADTETDTVKVTAWNRDNTPKGGYIHIIKTLENADKYTVEYVNSLIFKFKIQVDGYNETVVSLKPKLVNNKWIWEYLSDRYSWKNNQDAPNYTITEIDLPEGTEFVSATNDGNTVTENPSISGQLRESTSEDILITTDNSFVNKLQDPKQGDLIIEKKVTHESLNGQEFKFVVKLKGSFEYNGTIYDNEEVTIYDETNPVVVNGGSSKSIGTIKWYGNNAPEYTVIELESDIAKNVSVINASGTIKEGTGVTIATFVNDPILVGGYLSVTKQLEGNGLQDENFYFRISVEGYEPYVISLKANTTYKSEMYKWYKTENAPKYKVEEIKLPEGASLVEIINAEGQLVADQTTATQVVAINKYEEHTATFKVKKVVLDEKLIDASANQEFKMKVRVEGYYEIVGKDGIYTNGVFDISLKGGQTFTSPEIKWWGNKAPTVTVEEYDLPLGWENVGISNNGSPIDKDSNLEITVTNKLPVYVTLDLTTQLAGQVWEDEAQDKDGKNTAESEPNGIIDESEKAINGVEVYIYKVVKDAQGKEVERTEATVYKDINNTEMSLPITTSNDGAWLAPRVKIPAVSEEQKAAGYTAGYDVEFVYDGQTYEPTKFLATSNGDASAFINASTAEKDKFAKDSMALDYDRDIVNNRIQAIEGGSVIDGNGNTTGIAIGNEGINTLTYESNAVSNNGNDGRKVVSELVTTNEDGTIKDLYKAKARTSIGGLIFPFYRDTQNWNGFRLYNENTSITELGVEQKYFYEAVYNYCLHINLGLVRRADSDIGLAKDLYSAKVYVKGNEELIEYENFRFNTLADLNGDYYTRQVENQSVAQYTLGLYSTDYYYRAEMYKNDSGLYDKVANLSKDINSDLSEMEVELKYKIAVYNESGSYIQVVNSVNDYFDSSFGEPVKVELNGNEISNHSVTERNILGSDGVTYNKLEIKDLNIKLASGEVAEIYVTFKVQKDTINAVHDTIILGQKSNIAELASYSTLNLDGSVAGKVDKDSAPANLNIRSYNESSWYEDDTDAAPVLHLELKEENRKINGQVWEDRSEEGSAQGNGIKDDNEALIGGLTTQLVEKVTIDGIDYDFIWPTEESLNCLGGRSMKDLTGFDSTIETAREKVVTGEGTDKEIITEVGSYEFTGVPAGNYVVRFLYGNDKTKLNDSLDITGDPTALKIDGSTFSENDNILTANYDNDKEEMTSAVYNGQDFKATIYQAGYVSTDSEGYINNRNHDLANEALNTDRVSDARDSEARRLEIIANSETITNENSNVLITANEKAADHTKLYEQYNMFADTAILKLDIAAQSNGTTINNIDCGLIERPETALVLDKEIKSIKLTTNDNKVIFNADYDISYELIDNPIGKVVISEIDGKYLVANVKLSDSSKGIEVLQAIDKNENKLAAAREENKGTQNFRFINVEDEILQGTTIEINYLITALNVSETDYTSAIVENIAETANTNKTTEKAELMKLAREVKENTAKSDSVLAIGKYLGTNYYTGNIGNDKVVSTRVRQVVDYVDNDAIFTPAMNSTENHIWKTTNITELAGNGYDSERLIDKTVISQYELLDKHGVSYITDYKTNVILSVDTINNSELTGNSGFEAKLLPYEYDQEAYKSQIELTVTKTTSAQDKDLSYDNIAEIVKFQNTVGRRDSISVTGNANPKLGEFPESLKERDSSATELVTFTPPTGIEAEITITTQILIVVAIALLIVIGGIIIIKKKVL